MSRPQAPAPRRWLRTDAHRTRVPLLCKRLSRRPARTLAEDSKESPMTESTLSGLFYVLAFICGGLVLSIAPLVLAFLLAPRRGRAICKKTLESIECGMEPIGPAWIRFGVVYYLYALIFVAFSVDVLFLFPVAVVYNETPGWLELGEVVLFVAILTLVVVYAWKKGVFTWKSKLMSPRG
jgi:NADH-quinone oxidoreductase subunit A